MNTNKNKGTEGEIIAIEFLRKRGFQILQANFHARQGEIDIIAKDQDTLCFIEVKKYSPQYITSVYYAITEKKKIKIIKTAQYYLIKNKLDCPCRFDAILICGEQIDYIPGAFFS